jgi:hypothetical protein
MSGGTREFWGGMGHQDRLGWSWGLDLGHWLTIVDIDRMEGRTS